MELLGLRRWVIQQGLELTIREKTTGRAWKLSAEGVLKYPTSSPWGSPPEYTPEQIFQVADEFILADGVKTKTLTRSELELLLGKMTGKTGAASTEAGD